MKIIEYFKKMLSGYDGKTSASQDFDAEKYARARMLGSMDRNLSENEWQEFKELVNDGY